MYEVRQLKKQIKGILVFFSIAIFCILICGFVYNIVRKDNDINNYMSKRANFDEDTLPNLNSLPPYRNIHYQYRAGWGETIVLVVTYDEKTYIKEKSKLDLKKYLDHTVQDRDGIDYLIPAYEFSINSFAFRVLDTDESNYPQWFGMIATSDEKSSIAYLSCFYSSLDYISDKIGSNEMIKFIKESYDYDW